VRREREQAQGATGEEGDGQVAVQARRRPAQFDLLQKVEPIFDSDVEVVVVRHFESPDCGEGRQGDAVAGDGVEELDSAPKVRGHQPIVLPADPGPVLQPLGLAV